LHIRPTIGEEAVRRPVLQQDRRLAARRERPGGPPAAAVRPTSSRAASAASSGPKTGAAASRLALAREIAASVGYAQLACLNAAAPPGTTFRVRRSQRWRCGSCPGTKVDQARIADVLAGLGELPAPAAGARMRTYAAGELLYSPQNLVEVLFILKRGSASSASPLTAGRSPRDHQHGHNLRRDRADSARSC